MVKGLRALLVVLSTITGRVLSQSSNVTQCVADYQWSINTRGQTPCLVGAYLESLCSGLPVSVTTLPPGTHYLGPSFAQATPCLCNSVTYSVISACGGCQNRTFIDYPTWTLNCPSLIAIGQFPKPIPNTIELPSWASLNISLTNDSFNLLAAQREAERANAFPSASTTDSASGSTSTEVPSTTPQPGPSLPAASNSTSSSSDSGGLSPGGIAGVTVGSLVVVVIILLIIFWAMLRARRQRNAKPGSLNEPFSPINDRPQASISPFVQHTHAKSMSDPSSIVTPYTYSVSDRPPVSPGASTFHTTVPGRSSFEDVHNPQNVHNPMTMFSMQNTAPVNPAGPRGYTGAAEV